MKNYKMVYRIIDDAKTIEETFEAKDINDADKVAGRLLSMIRKATDRGCEIVELSELCKSKFNESTTQVNEMEVVSSDVVGVRIEAKDNALVFSMNTVVPKTCNVATELTALTNATCSQSIVNLKGDDETTGVVRLVKVTKVLPNNMKLGDLVNMRIAISNICAVCAGRIFNADCDKVISEAIKVFNANGKY